MLMNARGPVQSNHYHLHHCLLFQCSTIIPKYPLPRQLQRSRQGITEVFLHLLPLCTPFYSLLSSKQLLSFSDFASLAHVSTAVEMHSKVASLSKSSSKHTRIASLVHVFISSSIASKHSLLSSLSS